MNIKDGLRMFLVQLEANGRSQHTQRQYKRHVTAFASWLAPRCILSEISPQDLAEFMSSPAARQRPDGKTKKASTTNSLRSSLRGYFCFLHQSGIVEQNPARLLRPAICGRPIPLALTKDEQARLVAVLDDAPDRDRVLFRLMLAAGLRIGSAVALNVEDVDLVAGTLFLRSAKGNRPERAIIPRSMADMMAGFTDGLPPGPVFVARGGHRLSLRQGQRLFSRYATEAHLPTTRSHCLRHSFGTRILERTGNVRLAQAALRHRSITSTVLYLKVTDSAVRAAMEG